MRKAVFLDRDGTIIKQVDDLRRKKDLRLLPGAARAIKAFNRLGILVLVHSNQPVIARGWLTEEGLEKIHQELGRRLQSKGARIDAIYYCPHHPNADMKKYRVVCACRKPKTGLLRKAVKQFRVDPKRSFMIGDHTRDILAGKRAGMKTILVKTGYAGGDGRYRVKPDFVAKNLHNTVRIIRQQVQ